MSKKAVTILLKDAGYDQLKQFVNEVLGIQTKGNVSKAELFAKINEVGHQSDKYDPAQGKDERTITIMVDESPAAPPSAQKPVEGDVDEEESNPLLENDVELRARLAREKKLQDIRDQRKVTVFINITEEAGGSEPVPVSVNGRAMYIERGKPQEIRWPYFIALNNAVKYEYEPKGKNSEKSSAPRKVHIYGFSLQNAPEEANKLFQAATTLDATELAMLNADKDAA